MTDDELKDLVAETSRQIRELRASRAETEEALRDLASTQKRIGESLDEVWLLARSRSTSSVLA